MSNTTLEDLKTRRSVRAYIPDKMPEKELLDRIIKAEKYTNKGRGMKSPIIIAVTDKAVRDKLSHMNAEIMGTDSDPFYGAPVVLIVLADRKFPTYIYDGTLVMGNLLNATHAVGLAGCWIHRAKEIFNSAEGKAMLKEWGIEGDYEGIGNCIIGYPATDTQTAQKPRKPDYVHYV